MVKLRNPFLTMVELPKSLSEGRSRGFGRLDFGLGPGEGSRPAATTAEAREKILHSFSLKQSFENVNIVKIITCDVCLLGFKVLD
jgi:hypothetical protein